MLYMSRLKWAFLAAAALPQVALAQDGSAPPEDVAASSNTDIVVTAQRRSERLVDVPISVAVISNDTLQTAGVTSVMGIQKLVPGLRMDTAGPYIQPTLRGVGSAIAGPGAAPNVATYIDGFYQSNPLSADANLLGVESIQVLKGPQGTLFGRNSTGGAIVITTATPTQDFHADVRAGFGRFNEAYGAALVSGGLGENLAGSLALTYRHTDGFVRNIVTGRRDAKADRFTGRAKLVYTPSDTVKLTLIGEVVEIDDASTFALNIYEDGRGPLVNSVFVPGSVITSRRGEVSAEYPQKFRLHSQAAYFKAEFDLDFADLTSYTGYRRDKNRIQFDVDETSAMLLNARWSDTNKVFTQEFLLNSKNSSPLNWVLGAYYLRNVANEPNFEVSFGGSPFFFGFASKQIQESYAVFGDATYNFAPSLFLTLGGRFAYDKIEERFTAGGSTFSPNDDFNAFKPRVVLRYEFASRSNVYASFSQGQKAGIYNPSGSLTPVKPENITAYEVGLKTARGGWAFESAAFLYEYKNLQVNSFQGATAILLNAGTARIYGLEGHIAGPLADGLRLDLGATYLLGKYRSFPQAPHYTFDPTAAVPGIQIVTEDASGNRIQRMPRLSGNAVVTYTTDLAGGKLELSGNASYQSRVYFGFFEEENQKGYATLDLRGAWTTPDDRWTLAVYGRNVTNTNYIASVIHESTGIVKWDGQPVTYGVEARYKF